MLSRLFRLTGLMISEWWTRCLREFRDLILFGSKDHLANNLPDLVWLLNSSESHRMESARTGRMDSELDDYGHNKR